MAQLVQAPERQPRLGGIKDVAGEFLAVDHLGIAPLVWEDATCAFPAQTRAGCWDVDVDQEDKVFEGVGQNTTIASAFALYGGAECWIGGDSEGESYASQAEKILSQGEDRALEAKLAGWAVLAPGGESATTVAAAVAAADEYADEHYVGRPVLLMTRALADLAHAAQVLVREDGRLVTANGTPVLATSSFADDAPYGLAAIGQPAVYASPVRSADTVKTRENLARAIAERIYAIGVDCGFRHFVTIDTTP